MKHYTLITYLFTDLEAETQVMPSFITSLNVKYTECWLCSKYRNHYHKYPFVFNFIFQKRGHEQA